MERKRIEVQSLAGHKSRRRHDSSRNRDAISGSSSLSSSKLKRNPKPSAEFLYLCLRGYSSEIRVLYSIWSVPICSLLSDYESNGKMRCLSRWTDDKTPFNMACTNIGESVYFVGGRDARSYEDFKLNSRGTSYLSTEIMLCDVSNTPSHGLSSSFVPLQPMQSGKPCCYSVAVDGFLYVFAYSCPDAEECKESKYGFEVYDPTRDTWTALEDPPFFKPHSSYSKWFPSHDCKIFSYVVVDRKICMSSRFASLAYDCETNTWGPCALFSGFGVVFSEFLDSCSIEDKFIYLSRFRPCYSSEYANDALDCYGRCSPSFEFANGALVYDNDVLICYVPKLSSIVAYQLGGVFNRKVVKMQILHRLDTGEARVESKCYFADLGNCFFSMTYITSNIEYARRDEVQEDVIIITFRVSKLSSRSKFLECDVYPTVTHEVDPEVACALLSSFAE